MGSFVANATCCRLSHPTTKPRWPQLGKRMPSLCRNHLQKTCSMSRTMLEPFGLRNPIARNPRHETARLDSRDISGIKVNHPKREPTADSPLHRSPTFLRRATFQASFWGLWEHPKAAPMVTPCHLPLRQASSDDHRTPRVSHHRTKHGRMRSFFLTPTSLLVSTVGSMS